MVSKAKKESDRRLMKEFSGGLIRSKLKMLFFVGAMIVLLGFYFMFQEKFVYGTWTPVIATVTDVQSYVSSDENGQIRSYYDFTVSYSYNNQQKIDEKTRFSGTPPFKKGDGLPYQRGWPSLPRQS